MRLTTTQKLSHIEEGQAQLSEGMDNIGEALRAQAHTLNTIVERLTQLLELMTPKLAEGPTLQELLAELVVRIGDNGTLLRRIDRRTEGMAQTYGASGNGRGLPYTVS